jgi:hypothetical protein
MATHTGTDISRSAVVDTTIDLPFNFRPLQNVIRNQFGEPWELAKGRPAQNTNETVRMATPCSSVSQSLKTPLL